MDPTACLRNLLCAIEARDPDMIRAYAVHLAAWIENGGFSPDNINAIIAFANDNEDGTRTSYTGLGGR